jgi:hypothetical protein
MMKSYRLFCFTLILITALTLIVHFRSTFFSQAASEQAKPPIAQPVLPTGLEDTVKNTLGANYRPMKLPTTQQAKRLADDRANGESFGYSVALSDDGNTALIDARDDSEEGMQSNGAAYIFIRSEAGWSQQAKLLASDKAGLDLFGKSVALSADGNVAVIGALGHDKGGIDANGAAYIFTRSMGCWSEQAILLANDKSSADFFGWSVALSADGNIALIGAVFEDDNETIDNGAAYVFTHSMGHWSQQAKLLANDKLKGSHLGQSVSLSRAGDTALVGANGAAYVFTHSMAGWSQEGKLLPSDKMPRNAFGNSVSLSEDGNTALIGDFTNHDNNTQYNGAAYVFTYSVDGWSQQAKLLANDKADFDHFGGSVVLSRGGDAAFIGTYGVGKREGVTGNGAAYIFTHSMGNWTQQKKLLANDKTANNNFGWSMALSGDGNTMLIGSWGNSTVYVFVIH